MYFYWSLKSCTVTVFSVLNNGTLVLFPGFSILGGGDANVIISHLQSDFSNLKLILVGVLAPMFNTFERQLQTVLHNVAHKQLWSNKTHYRQIFRHLRNPRGLKNNQKLSLLYVCSPVLSLSFLSLCNSLAQVRCLRAQDHVRGKILIILLRHYLGFSVFCYSQM